MISPSLLLVYVLANWRLASLLSREGGPWGFLHSIRHAVGVRYDERSEMYGQNVISRGLICLWCNSIWIGIIQVVVHLIAPSIALYISLPLALSAGAIALEEITK